MIFSRQASAIVLRIALVSTVGCVSSNEDETDNGSGDGGTEVRPKAKRKKKEPEAKPAYELKDEEVPKSNRSQISKVDDKGAAKAEPKKEEKAAEKTREEPPPRREEPRKATVAEPFPGVAVTPVGASGTVMTLKVAVTDCEALIVTAQIPLPAHPPPDQLARYEPMAGVAVSVTIEPFVKGNAQIAPQLIPAGLEITVPVAASSSRTILS